MPICQRSLYSDHLECTPYASLIVSADVHPAKISSECIRKSLLATAKVDMSIRTHGTYHTNLFALSGNFLICHNDSIQQLQILGQAHQNINIATFDASVQLFLCVRVKQKVSLLPYTASSLSATIHPNVRVSSISAIAADAHLYGGGGGVHNLTIIEDCHDMTKEKTTALLFVSYTIFKNKIFLLRILCLNTTISF